MANTIALYTTLHGSLLTEKSKPVSRLFHSLCHDRTTPCVTTVPQLWNNCVTRVFSLR
ncbi:hypothetical protein [Prevotella sp. P5-92]|uniref:hypothetical protein n=1 Tax=Prevotella sp. P5-92 TaxID=2024222 RepID=UPI001303E827|nr:hypothetical protein [Prevotella sp. P5-92]